METPETIRTSLQAGEWVTSIDFKHTSTYQFTVSPGSTCAFTSRVGPTSSSPSLWPVHSSHGVHSGGQRGQTRGFSEGYKDPPVPRRLAGESLYPPHLSPAYSKHTLVTLCQELGWLVNKEKLELVPKQVFNFVGYQFDLKEGKVRPTEERWQALTHKIRSILSDPLSPVRQFMSLIGLLTATEKQVHLGRLT